jgi:D-glycero-D-manno-heptose 1,7-bisphosphate phosphatase
MSEVILIMGCPASGKGTKAKEYIDKGYVHLNRDEQGGKVVSLVPLMEKELQAGNNVVLDNLYATRDSRKPFIQACKNTGVPIHCVHVNTSIEEAQINALRRMYQRYGRFFMNAEEIKADNRAKKDSNMFPPFVLFKYRKDFEEPLSHEGFDSIETVEFKREWSPEYCNKALILDYDQNIRDTTCSYGYPIKPEDVYVLPGRSEKIQEYVEQGYILCGVSNQSGVHKGNFTYEAAVECFEHTNKLLGHNIDFTFCPHQSSPPACYCRKPGVGNGVKLIEKYKLSPNLCIFVGDQTTDRTFAERCGFKFIHTHKFFK